MSSKNNQRLILCYYVFSPMSHDCLEMWLVEMEELHHIYISKIQSPKHSVDLHATGG